MSTEIANCLIVFIVYTVSAQYLYTVYLKLMTMKYYDSLWFSFQIYNELIRDLLNPGSGFLDLREDQKGVQVAGLSEHSASSTEEVCMSSRGLSFAPLKAQLHVN